jgi:hypothetical protein
VLSRAATTLKALVPLLEQKNSELTVYDKVDGLIQETEKSFQAMHLAKQSQKYSPFQTKVRKRLDHI